MKRFFFLAVITCMAIVSLQAQLITWAVRPGTYSKIEPCWENMYFAYNGNSIGIINGDGRVIVAPEASRITGFYGGLALVLKSDGGQERILGILASDGSYTKVDGTYFTIPYQEFFSEGLLTFMTSKGQAGYMNVNGVIVKSFNASFVSPFSEGYAVVGENEEYSIIDKRFNTLAIQLGTVSQVYGGSNVYKGIAVVWDGNGKFYNFDVKNGTCKKISEPSSLDYDYMYCFSCITKRPENVPYEQPLRTAQTLAAAEQGGKYGYVKNDETILPYQFDKAESFYGNYAIVVANGKYALLSLHQSDETFNVIANSEIKYKSKESTNIPHVFGISVPSRWQTDDLVIRVSDENGLTKEVANKNGNYEFLCDASTDTKTFNVGIESDGLRLWNGVLAYNYEEIKEVILPDISDTRVKNFTVTLKVNNSMADINEHCNVTATVYNPNSEDISATVTFSGSNLLEKVSKRVTVPANGTKDVSTYFLVKKVPSQRQSVTVTTSAGGSATLDGLQLIPFEF